MNPLSIFALALEQHRIHPEDLDPSQLAQLKTDLPARIFDEAAARCSELEQDGITVISYLDTAYPEQLKRIRRPPALLYLRGILALHLSPWIAIVGSRSCSREARDFSHELAAEIARRGGVVVSGLAYGCDAAAHRGAISGNGETAGVAVLGSGVKSIYPAEHEELATQILSRQGAIISEAPPASTPRKGSFPARNRIISGLCVATVIVEAREKSGSLITARLAAEQGREVFAVPSSPFSGRSDGGNQLIKDGARILTCFSDLAEFFPKQEISHRQKVDKRPPSEPILFALEGGPLTFEELLQELSIDPNDLLSRISTLELEGAIYCENGELGLRRG
jgi:DNA processing protein